MRTFCSADVRRIATPMLVALVTVVVFLPALDHGFVWDDERNFTGNPWYRGLGFAELRWMFTAFHMGIYVPLAWVSLGVDYVLWGMNPRGYHLTNVLLHALNAAFTWSLAVRLLRAASASRACDGWRVHVAGALAALLFSAHPLRAESVAWVTERRDVLSGAFYLSAILAYLKSWGASTGPPSPPALGDAAGNPRRPSGSREATVYSPGRLNWWYWTSVAVFGLALLAKPITVTLPVALVILDVYPLRRLGGAAGWLGRRSWTAWAEKIPFVLLSVAISTVTLVGMLPFGHMPTMTQLPWPERLALVAHSWAFYMWKLVWPVGLVPMYELRPLDFYEWPYVLSAAVVVAISIIAVALRRRAPAVLAAWLVYLVTVLPVSGIAQNGPQMAADRYTYLASVPWAVLAAGALLFAVRAVPRTAVATAVVVVALLSVLTWKQALIWRDDETLWTHAVRTAPSAIAHSNLGGALALKGRWSDAMPHAYAALQLAPDFANPHFVLGHAASRVDRWDDALSHFRRALRIDPTFAEAHNSLGALLGRLDRWDEALPHFQRALELRPHFPQARHNLDVARRHRASTPAPIRDARF